MEEFLTQKALEHDKEMFEEGRVHYAESLSPDAIDGDKWLENRTSYIWKVAVLSIIDGNKADWAHVFIGHQREPDQPMEYIGHLFWFDGENDDIGRCLRRYLECLSRIHPIYEDN